MFKGFKQIASLTASASRNSAGRITLTISNLDPDNTADLDCKIEGINPNKISARILTAEKMNTRNTFENPDNIHPQTFSGVEIKNGRILTTLPPKSLTLITIN